MEDAPRGDITSQATIPEGTRCVATLTAKGETVVAGLPLFAATFRVVDERCRIVPHVKEGEMVAPGTKLATVTGPARSVLTGERVALNFLQRLSGVASLTRKFVDAVAGTGCVILDTRKTTPLMRDLEKYAVTAGGGENHRRDLSEAILIKENHIAAAGGIAKAVIGARTIVGRRGFVEVEAETLDQVKQALEAGANRILLDNMTPAEVKKAVALVGKKAETEASGNMTLTTVRRYAEAGVGYISVGSLTHSAPAADLSLRVDL
ncbi:MAG: carboxylating nicotinate-nucleotide diphosphorylase [Nitrospinae bacterium]|nr:carboxylating nicotinate-nucleotide diphosphorylase [Nitrospinota bacterium]